MTRFLDPRALALGFALLLSACAGSQVRTPAASAPVVDSTVAVEEATTVDPAAQVEVDTETMVAVDASNPEALVVDGAIVQTTTDAASATPQDAQPPPETTAAEDDFIALYGNPEYDPVADPTLPPGVQMPIVYDPWEGFNRRVHDFNNFFDRIVATPLARLYVKAIPRPVRLGVSNFFSNLGEPITTLNSLLQGKPKQAAQSFGRFLLNSTLGIGGIFDPASDANLPRKNEDFGQSLGVWGWKRSRYVELPLFGPRTLRDTFGLVGDAPLSPIRQVEDDRARYFLQGLQLVDLRTQLFALDSIREGAADEYALVRDAWLQRRNYQIQSDRRQKSDDLPDYLLDDETNPTVPVDVMPIVPLSPIP